MQIQHRLFGRFQHAFQTAQQGKRQDNAPILRALEIAAQQISDRPDKLSIGVLVVRHASTKTVVSRRAVA